LVSRFHSALASGQDATDKSVRGAWLDGHRVGAVKDRTQLKTKVVRRPVELG
jgi:hypothetical protein